MSLRHRGTSQSCTGHKDRSVHALCSASRNALHALYCTSGLTSPLRHTLPHTINIPYLRDFRLPPRCKCDRRSSWMLRREYLAGCPETSVNNCKSKLRNIRKIEGLGSYLVYIATVKSDSESQNPIPPYPHYHWHQIKTATLQPLQLLH